MEIKKKQSQIVTINDPKYKKPITYVMTPRLKKILDNKVIPSLLKKDKDCFIAVDGMEGGGKSTLAFQIGKYVDPTLDLSRVVFDAESFKQAIFKAHKGQCVIFDEAFTGLSSRASLSGINRALISLAMQMRQKNLFIIIVLPTFFLLDKYVALWRSRALIHVYENKGRRGYYRIYNRKKKKYLYLAGKQTYSYNHKKVWTNFKGHFYGNFALGDDKCEELYRKKKAKALEDTEKNPMSAGQVKYKEQRDLSLYLLRKTSKMTYQELSNLMSDYDLEMSLMQIRNICAKFGDKGSIEEERAKKERIELEAKEEARLEQEKNQIEQESDDFDDLEDEKVDISQ